MTNSVCISVSFSLLSPQVVEYSEITPETARRTNESGTLLFNAGNIANHFLSTDFLARIASHYGDQLIYHLAEKKIPFLDETGTLIKVWRSFLFSISLITLFLSLSLCFFFYHFVSFFSISLSISLYLSISLSITLFLSPLSVCLCFFLLSHSLCMCV